MPELPDLEYVIPLLKTALVGKQITGWEVKNPIVLREHVLTQDVGLNGLLADQTVNDVFRHGPFVRFQLDRLTIVVHPMLAGQFYLSEPGDRLPRATALIVDFDPTTRLVYADRKQMGRVYAATPQQLDEIPGYLSQGVDVLSDAFTWDHFISCADKDRKQVRVFLMDQTRISAIGNAYADEILFAAGIHPKHPVNKLSPEQLRELFDAIGSTLEWGIEEVRNAARPIHEKYRDHVKVRNRKNQPCPTCGTTIRRTTVYGYDSFFCPRCQPEPGAPRIPW